VLVGLSLAAPSAAFRRGLPDPGPARDGRAQPDASRWWVDELAEVPRVGEFIYAAVGDEGTGSRRPVDIAHAWRVVEVNHETHSVSLAGMANPGSATSPGGGAAEVVAVAPLDAEVAGWLGDLGYEALFVPEPAVDPRELAAVTPLPELEDLVQYHWLAATLSADLGTRPRGWSGAPTRRSSWSTSSGSAADSRGSRSSSRT
jgi:hypothetical protein